MNTKSQDPQSQARAHLHLPEDETRLFEYIDDQCSAEQAQATRERLGNCTECQALDQQWRRLDSQLSTALDSPTLSADFVTRLLNRIELPTASPVATPGLRENRPPSETEWQKHWAQHRKDFWRFALPTLLDYIGYAVALALTGGLLSGLLNYYLQILVGSTVPPSSPLGLSIACGIGAIFLLATIAAFSKVRLWRWLADL